MDISNDESSDSEVADPNYLAMVLYHPLAFRAKDTRKKVPTLMIDLDTLFSSAFYPRVVGSTSKVVTSKDAAPTPAVMETLKELKKENEFVRECLDKQDETNKEIKSWMMKQEESSNEIKNLLLSLVSRQTSSQSP